MVLRNALSPLVRKISASSNKGLFAVQNVRHASYESHGPVTTMDDLPVPNGSWETQYNANQTKYNMHLAAGIAMTIFTIIVAKTSGLVYLNWSPPKDPAPRE